MIGTVISHYSILEKLGEGGMGVVYKARDTKLDREVALKFLPAHLAASEKDRARFVQEAKAAATLNHPNICTIHDIGEEPGGEEARIFIVMELVQGQTLQERKASLTARQAIDVGIQVAEGLAAAHERGIVHRDIKPENIMLRKDGIAQIMDFGLARVRSSRNTRLTREGSTVGTAGYMSPEQVQGLDTDHRSDIFSLGVLLYEMFAGRMPFQGVHETAIHYEVVNVDPPPPSAVKPGLDPEIDRIVLECLQKEPDERYNAVKDVAKDLKRFKRESSRERASGVTAVRRSTVRQEAASGPPSGAEALPDTDPGRGANLRAWAWPAVAAVTVLAVFGWLVLRGGGGDPVTGTTRFILPIDAGQILARSTVAVDVSADGRNVALLTQDPRGEGRMVRIRQMDGLATRTVPGTEWAMDLSLSPDGEWIAFSAEGKLKKVPLRGGAPTVLANIQATRGIDWGEGGRIVYAPNAGSAIWSVGAGGGEPEAISTLDSASGEVSHRHPELLPGGEAILFTAKTKNITSFSEARIVVQRLDTKERKVLVDGGSFPRYLASGHLLYASGPSLLVAPFDPASLELTGASHVVVDSAGMLNEGFGYASAAVSASGTLVYAQGGPLPVVKNRITMRDRTGRILPFLDLTAAFGEFTITPDRRLVAAQLYAANDDIWIYDVERALATRFTFAGGNNWTPLWTPDGRGLVHTAERNGGLSVVLRSADGSGSERELVSAPFRQWSDSFTPDGKILVYSQLTARGDRDLMTVAADGSAGPRPFLESRFNERSGMVSPDGRLIAYVSDESGQGEIYVRTFPDGGGKLQISTAGGFLPRWAKAGRELIYVGADLGVLSVPVSFDGGVRAGRAAPLFRLAKEPTDLKVSADGERFWSTEFGDAVDIDRLTVVIGWFAELGRTDREEKRR